MSSVWVTVNFLSLFSWLCSTKYISIYPFCTLNYTRIFVFCVASAAVFLCIGMSGSRYVSTPVCLPYTYCSKRSSIKTIASISLSLPEHNIALSFCQCSRHILDKFVDLLGVALLCELSAFASKNRITGASEKMRKGVNSIALEHSWRNSIGQSFFFFFYRSVKSVQTVTC